MKHTILKTMVLSVLLTLGCQSQDKQKEAHMAQSSNVNNPVNRIEAYLSKLEESGFSGSILFAKNDKVLINKGYGFSDRSKQIKNASQTVFDIGSITKQFTAAGILKLEMQGKLSVDDKITKYFDNIPEDKKSITIHQLLTHSSGFLSGIGDDYEAITSQGFINRAFKKRLLFEPGSAYEYSNVGYSLLGMIIEKVSGQSYENYLYTNLWKPSKMEQTGYTRPTFSDQNVAYGYDIKDKALGKPNELTWDVDAPYWHLKANGGILSTANDMYKWHNVLKSNLVLSNEAITKYFTPYVKEGDAQSYYAYGWAMYKTSRGTTLAAHNGGNGIFFADFWRYLDDDMVIIVLNNKATRYSEIIASQIGALYILKDFEPMYPENRDMEMEDFDENEVDDLVGLVVKTLNQNDENKWTSFIQNNGTNHFINMAPMELHLNYFKKFHQKIKGGKVVGINIDLDEVIVTVKTENSTETLIINIENNNEGQLKFAGMMIE
ncbi:serine hydrolase domain-containing protein [uncultured Psychroserpens sp.]|uniref:serine hydrolase domain-containing protein n=1 Tax=uncultured Psychroserpens sp. TaxID=255436 RepID=UPI002610D496|nr:serine hydrolase domain-containing protein [uncultured Psychroserpens sp.]